jgi:hypothetical protein
MRRTTKKRRFTLDSLILITTEENFLNIEYAKTSRLINAGMSIIDATLDREKNVKRNWLLH